MNHLFAEINRYISADDFHFKVKEKMYEVDKNNINLTIATIDIDNFNYVNDLLGFETGDLILRKLAEIFSSYLKGEEFFTRIHADIFAICLCRTNQKEIETLFTKIANTISFLQDILPSSYKLTTSTGIVILKDIPPYISVILDRANYARQKAKSKRSNTLRFYDEEMHKEMEWQNTVTFSMESALKNGEFEMYLQPKVSIVNNSVVGAEALVRWNHPNHGIIMPGGFIPIMEQSGFIQELDFFMLKEACNFLNHCTKIGIPQMPISVNFSKSHLVNENLVDEIFSTVNDSGIHTELIEIEFTESMITDGYEKLIEFVTNLKLLGFKVSLDDFGSAYSSLSCLKELPIDIIKIDKGFLDASFNTEKSQLIVSKIIEMIKSLHMRPIMEGVETFGQVEFLRKLSCDYAQGYFFAKPMPKNTYLDYLNLHISNSNPEDINTDTLEEDKSYLYKIPQEFQMDNWELYTLGQNIDMGLMKGYLDGEATVQYINDRALEYLGYTRQEFREIFNNSIVAFAHPEDAHIVQESTKQLIESGKPLKFRTRAIRKDGKVIVLQGNSSCVIDNKGRPVGLYAFQDVTDELEHVDTLQKSLTDKIAELESIIKSEREARESLYLSEERYRVIVEQSNDVMFDWNFLTDEITFSDKFFSSLSSIPVFKDPMHNREIRKQIHPSDILEFDRFLKNIVKIGGTSKLEFRALDLTEEYMWMRCNSTVISDTNGSPIRAVGLISNINSERCEIEQLTYKSQRDPLTGTLNKEELRIRTEQLINTSSCISGAFFMIDIDNFKSINDNLGHQLGDTVLVELTRKMKDALPNDSLIGRMGGDEIGAFIPHISSEKAWEYAEALVLALRMSYYGASEKYNVSASVGVALYPVKQESFDELYHRADIALYEAKRVGKDRFVVFNDSMTGSFGDVRTPVECTESFLNSYFGDDFPFSVFEMLYETKDIDASVSMIIKLMGERFKVERVYIFQNDEHHKCCHNTYEWCASGITSEKENLQSVPYDLLRAYWTQYSEEGVYCCGNINNAPKDVFDICYPQGIKSMLHCAIHNKGEQVGFIGFDMCSEYHEWTGEEIAVLGYISRILSVFLLRADISLELKNTYQNYVEMVENLSGFVYVVDPKTYEVLYINDATKALGVNAEYPCYKMAFGTDKPCKNCPMNRFSETTKYATEEIYSVLLPGWVCASASKIIWEGNRDAGLVCCMDISKYKKDLPNL